MSSAKLPACPRPVVWDDRANELLVHRLLVDRLMRCNGFETRDGMVVCATAWMIGSVCLFAAAGAVAAAAVAARVESPAPLVIENPYLKQRPDVPAPTAPLSAARPVMSLSPAAPPIPSFTARIPVVGAMIDADAPVAYRLPDVSSFTPTPIDAVAGPAPQIVPAPSPPTLEVSEQAAPSAAGAPIPATETSSTSGRPADRGMDLPGGRLNPGDHHSTPTAQHAQLPTGPTRDPADGGDRPERSLLMRSTRAGSPAIPPQTQVPPGPSAPWRPAAQPGDIAERTPPATIPYAPTTAELTSQLLPAVQRGYALGQRGALFAAQTEFVQVLRRVAQAKDAASRSDEHSRALAAGLRALDEAEDFVPGGMQLEGDLDLKIVASAHRTPVVRDDSGEIAPHQAVALYLGYAQRQLARAAAGEQAGSMALHGLGKIYARLAERQDDDVQLAQRATAMFSAALAVRPDNYLAANELGVQLCRNGHAAEAIPLFERAIDAAPTALAYHNLAVAQRKLGLPAQAVANEQESQRLAAWERATGAVSRRAGVQWVSPAEMSRVAQPAPLAPVSYNAAAPPPPRTASIDPRQKSPWHKALDLSKSLTIPGIESTRNIRNAVPETRVARPPAPPGTPAQSRWR